LKIIYRFCLSTLVAGVCSAQTITAFAGGEDYFGFGGDGGSALSALFSAPGSLAIDGAGGLYILDGDNWRVRRVTADGIINTIAGNGDVSSPLEGRATDSSFLALYDLAISPSGILYIADSDGLQRIDQSGGLNFVVTGQSVQKVAISSQGTIYLADATIVSRLERDGSMTPVAGSDLGDLGDGGPATQAQFYVTALATDRIGNVFVLDGESSRVRKFAPGGLINTIAGTGVGDYGGDGGPANQASLNGPSGIAVDVAGNVYVADTGNHKIRRVTTDGNIATFAGQFESGAAGDNGPALQAFLQFPTNLAVSCTALYLNDANRIRAISLTSPLLAQAGVFSMVTAFSTVRGGEKFSIAGCNLATTSASADPTFTLPTTLGGATVTVGGLPASLVSVSPTQIVAQLPAGIPSGTAPLVVSVSGTGTAAGSMSVN
jgi:trimeric autotransporter adhesin